MPTFQNTVTIRRPVEDVFVLLADFENIPRWNYAISAAVMSPGSHAPYRWGGRLAGW